MSAGHIFQGWVDSSFVFRGWVQQGSEPPTVTLLPRRGWFIVNGKRVWLVDRSERVWFPRKKT